MVSYWFLIDFLDFLQKTIVFLDFLDFLDFWASRPWLAGLGWLGWAGWDRSLYYTPLHVPTPHNTNSMCHEHDLGIITSEKERDTQWLTEKLKKSIFRFLWLTKQVISACQIGRF